MTREYDADPALVIKVPRQTYPGKTEDEQAYLLRPRGDAYRDRLVSERLKLRRDAA